MMPCPHTLNPAGHKRILDYTESMHERIPHSPRFRGLVFWLRCVQELGIPTANLDREALQGALAEAVSGIYLGWAAVGSSPEVHQMVMSIGWNPFFNNKVRNQGTSLNPRSELTPFGKTNGTPWRLLLIQGCPLPQIG